MCDLSAESEVNYSVVWQDSTGSCVSESIMFELQCAPSSPFSIRIGLTENGELAPYNKPDAENLWYMRSDRTLDELPLGTIDTGLSHTGRSLHIASNRETAYVVTGQLVESWQRVNVAACM